MGGGAVGVFFCRNCVSYAIYVFLSYRTNDNYENEKSLALEERKILADFNLEKFYDVLQREVAASDVASVAKRIGHSYGYVYKLLRREQDPKLSVAVGIVEKLGYTVQLYREP